MDTTIDLVKHSIKENQFLKPFFHLKPISTMFNKLLEESIIRPYRTSRESDAGQLIKPAYSRKYEAVIAVAIILAFGTITALALIF
ncbi:MAG: hypothetical protein KTR26_03955 [Flammeovirgaceae bacterium]|nr:hypothetical protein [Flammeovirgaceae bacterium]